MKRLESFYYKHIHNWVVMCAILALIINLIIETLARQTAYGGVLFLVQHPIRFFYCALIIFTCLSVSLLFRHRVFVVTVAGSIWLGFGIVNGIILSQRMTPFTTTDLQEMKDGISLATTYLSFGQIAMIIGIIAVVVFAIFMLYHKAPVSKEKIQYKKAISAFLIIVIVMGGTTFFFTKAKIVDTYFPNLAYGYRDNGFTYCFLATWLDKGISKPVNYSASKIDKIFTKEERKTEVGGKYKDGTESHPNIIFIQLESFVDPYIAKDVKFSKDPIPYVRKLMKRYSSAHLTVPVVGAGTANTEFESITGMSARLFGPGEYPYRTILSSESCESIPFDLKQIGYSTHAIHNHRGIFYNRNKVFPNLGFDTFTSLEYMNNVSKTPKGWAKDNVLTGCITDALKSTKGSDYIYTVSVQGHGQYPSQQVITDPKITVTKAPTTDLKYQWEYYVNQEYEMDQFVHHLLNTLKKYKEHTVVVFYGDHLPGMSNLTDDNLTGGRNVYQTDYVMWSNFKMKKVDKPMTSYQLGSYVLGRLGIHNGTMVTYHQKYSKSKNYTSNLKALEYDILYGNRYIYGGKSPFKKTNMRMGVKTIKIKKVIQIGENYYIKGENFTESSKITLDGKVLKTVYLGPTILGLKEEVDPKDVSKMKVSQVDKTDDTILSTCE